MSGRVSGLGGGKKSTIHLALNTLVCSGSRDVREMLERCQRSVKDMLETC
jgi:hypothetical protein